MGRKMDMEKIRCLSIILFESLSRRWKKRYQIKTQILTSKETQTLFSRLFSVWSGASTQGSTVPIYYTVLYQRTGTVQKPMGNHEKGSFTLSYISNLSAVAQAKLISKVFPRQNNSYKIPHQKR